MMMPTTAKIPTPMNIEVLTTFPVIDNPSAVVVVVSMVGAFKATL